MDDVLARALEPVLRDLRSTGVVAPTIEDVHWTDDPDLPSAYLWGRDGNGRGVLADRDEPEHEQVRMVADRVQEWVIEELWGRAPTNWPPCPQHPDTHPLTPVTTRSLAEWVCPTHGTAVAPVGGLPPAATPGPERT